MKACFFKMIQKIAINGFILKRLCDKISHKWSFWGRASVIRETDRMEEKTMPYFRDSTRPEDYWGDGQWKIYKTMKGMDILPASDNLTIPGHIGGAGSQAGREGPDPAGQIPRNTAVMDTGFAGLPKATVPKMPDPMPPGAADSGGGTRSGDLNAHWDAAAHAMTWPGPMTPSVGSATDAIADIGSLIDGMKKRRPAFAARAKTPAAKPVSASEAEADGGMAAYRMPAEGKPAAQPGMGGDDDAAQRRRQSYQAGLQFGGRDPADEGQARQDWQEVPAARAAGYLVRAFYDGNIKTGGKLTDPFIHGYNLYQADFTPAEHLSPEENEAVERGNAEVVSSLEEIADKGEKFREYQKDGDAALQTGGKPTLLGELVDKGSIAASHAGEALLDTRGGKVWQAFSAGSDAASTAMKTYREKMLAYRQWRDDAICDPAANPLFGAWCQRKIRAGEDKRTVAMQTRRNMAVVHALKEVGIDIGVKQLKNWFGRATGHDSEGPLIRFSQNIGMDVAEGQIENAWHTYREDVAEKGREALDAINDAHEWHLNNN